MISFKVRWILLTFIVTPILAYEQDKDKPSGMWELVIMHTNDINGRLRESDTYGRECNFSDPHADCYGGFARIKTMVDEIRVQFPNNSLLLDAGDQWTGTVLFYILQYPITVTLMNMVGYDAMAVGYHEHDLGFRSLGVFANKTNFPVIACNQLNEKIPALKYSIGKSTVFQVKGRDVGIVGYFDDRYQFQDGDKMLVYADIAASVQHEVNKLTKRGVKIIIALGAAGYKKDLDLAKRLHDVDVIVGSISNTFLYTGETPPSIDVPQGTYPTVVRVGTKAPVLVVQDFQYGKYLGNLHMWFDDQGRISKWEGNPILLDDSVEKDENILHEIGQFLPYVEKKKGVAQAISQVEFLNDILLCRSRECNLGNLVADSMVYAYWLKRFSADRWASFCVGVVQADSLTRGSNVNKGTVTHADALNIVTMNYPLTVVTVTGKTIWDMMEVSISRWTDDREFAYAAFLQVSGIEVVFDPQRSVGLRAISVKVRCADCPVPKFHHVEWDKHYNIVMTSYLRGGGLDYYMFPLAIIKETPLGYTDTESFIEYISDKRLTTGVEGRIQFVQDLRQDRDIRCVNSSREYFMSIGAAVLLSLWLTVSFT